MRLERLALSDFRNFQKSQLSLKPRINFFLGENGHGKTNLIEAVFLLCRGHSFRPANAESLIRKGAERTAELQRAKIHGSFHNESGLDYQVEIGLKPGQRSLAINGKNTNTTHLLERFPIVLFSPESLSAIKEGPEQRRILIDEILLSHEPKKGRLLRDYARALKSRNRLLRNIAEGIGTRSSQLLALESLNKIFFLLATDLVFARLKALRNIEPDLSASMTAITGGGAGDTREPITFEYLVSSQPAMGWNESEIFDALRSRHAVLADKECLTGTSLVGPHKHDIKLLLDGNDSRFYCSQGQQRAMILALKIAQIVYHHRVHETYPILLLDDVMSELDAQKRTNLMEFLAGISAQILITATDLTWSNGFAVEKNAVFSVARGTITSEQPLT